jgi:AraC-like DNA-binding protein
MTDFMQMEYREFLPHPLLRSTVECYWCVQGHSTDLWMVYPDACMDILFDFGASETFVVGNMFKPIESHGTGYTDMFGIRFRASGMSHIVRAPLSEFNDISASFDTAHRSGPEAVQLQPLSVQERVNTLDRWLLKRMTFSNSKPDAWEYCLDMIVKREGCINVHDLAREAGISQKQMERKFIEKVGPTPKQFAQLLKFRKLKEHLEKRKDESLMNIAFDFDFTDHAHLTKFFRKFAGITPTEFCLKSTKH